MLTRLSFISKPSNLILTADGVTAASTQCWDLLESLNLLLCFLLYKETIHIKYFRKESAQDRDGKAACDTIKREFASHEVYHTRGGLVEVGALMQQHEVGVEKLRVVFLL